MTETVKSRSLARIYVVDDGEGKFLMVEFLIDCPACGQQRIQIDGHHLKMVRDTCIDAIDQHPELCGVGEPKVVDSTEFKSQRNDPSTS